jgi:hypothetical protein
VSEIPNDDKDILETLLMNEKDKDPFDQGLQTLMDSLTCGKHKIGIEFECGECCKKVLNGAKIFTFRGLVILLPFPGDCLFMKIFSGGKLVDKQKMRAIVVPVSRICAVEIEPVQIDDL